MTAEPVSGTTRADDGTGLIRTDACPPTEEAVVAETAAAR